MEDAGGGLSQSGTFLPLPPSLLCRQAALTGPSALSSAALSSSGSLHVAGRSHHSLLGALGGGGGGDQGREGGPLVSSLSDRRGPLAVRACNSLCLPACHLGSCGAGWAAVCCCCCQEDGQTDEGSLWAGCWQKIVRGGRGEEAHGRGGRTDSRSIRRRRRQRQGAHWRCCFRHK